MEQQMALEKTQNLLNAHSEVFERFLRLLLRYNEKYNLTAITEEREIWAKHFFDSVAGEHLFPEGASVLEVGSGAGFPSIPLMLVRPDLTFTLVESTKKKCDFLAAAKEQLSLPAEILPMRAEDAARGEWREKFDVSVARAVARLNTLAEYCLPFAKEGGVFLAYKGGNAEEELKEAGRAISLLGGGGVSIFPYSLPEGMGERTIVAVKKICPTPAKYPRGRGKERSMPL